MLRIAIPKNLLDKVERLFSEAEIPMKRERRSLRVEFPGSDELAEGFLLRARTIPPYIRDWMFDLAIVGKDILAEHNCSRIVPIKPLLCKRLGLCTTRVALFCKRDDLIFEAKDIPPGLRIISEYPHLTRKFFKGKVDLKVDGSEGGCEVECLYSYRFGVAVVETGETLRANSLREMDTIFQSKPMLVANRDSLANNAKKGRVERLVAKLEKVLD